MSRPSVSCRDPGTKHSGSSKHSDGVRRMRLLAGRCDTPCVESLGMGDADTPALHVLGRGVVVNAGASVPERWADAPRVVVDDATLVEPQPAVDTLFGAWSIRSPIVVELRVDPDRVPRPGVDHRRRVVAHAAHRAVVRPAPLPRVGEQLRRPHRRADLVVVHEGGPHRRRQLRRRTVHGRRRRPPRRRLARLDRRWPAPAWAAGVLGAAVVHSESVDLGTAVRRRGGRRAHRRAWPPTSSRRSAIVPAPRGSSLRPAPARPGCSPSAFATSSSIAATSRGGVLAVAYNKQAQLEMEARTTDFGPAVRTLNSLGLWVLARHRGSSPAGHRRARGAASIVDSLLPGNRRRRANTDPIGPYLEALAAVRLGLRDPEEVEASRDDVDGFAELFPLYRERLAAKRAVDFDEQIYGAIETLLRDGEFRRDMQRSCRHLLVDEFQDLTPAHVLHAPAARLPELDVFGVGDDDQCIYGHAGADPAFLIEYGQLFPGARPTRCGSTIDVRSRSSAARRRCSATTTDRVAKEIVPGPANDPAPARSGRRARRRRGGRRRRVAWSRSGSPIPVSSPSRSRCCPASTRCCSRRTSRCTTPACPCGRS